MTETEVSEERADWFDASGAHARGRLLLSGYAPDFSDKDVLHLLRVDGTTAAAFSARGASSRGVTKAAEEDVHAMSDGRLP